MRLTIGNSHDSEQNKTCVDTIAPKGGEGTTLGIAKWYKIYWRKPRKTYVDDVLSTGTGKWVTFADCINFSSFSADLEEIAGIVRHLLTLPLFSIPPLL